MLADVIKRHNTEGMVMRSGSVVRELPKNSNWEVRPTVEIEVDNRPFNVKARLMMDTFESIPKRVTFYYGGDPNEEVHLREEASSIWFIVLTILVPGILLWAEQRSTDSSEDPI